MNLFKILLGFLFVIISFSLIFSSVYADLPYWIKESKEYGYGTNFANPDYPKTEPRKSILIEPEILITHDYDDENRAKSYVVRIFGGELDKVYTFKTFSKVEPGDTPHFIKSFHDLGFTSYFALESLPSKDKMEFYNIVSKYLKPGKPPEPFDSSIDVIAGDGSVIITANYSKCIVTEYTPYTQELILIYQFSNEQAQEIRDRTVLYCAGLDIEVTDSDDQQSVETVLETPIPPENERANYYVVHFFGPDFDGVYTINTFSKFSPSINQIETPIFTITVPGNPFSGSPQVILESLPSKDKDELYRFFAKWINPGQPPEPFNVSIDMVSGDGTILQRWNYVDCELADYTLQFQESMLRFPFSGEKSPEIRDKTDLRCIGLNLDVPYEKELDKTPVKDPTYFDKANLSKYSAPEKIDSANSYLAKIFGGELKEIFSTEHLQKFEPIALDRGPLTPLGHSKQYDFGFEIESLPTKDKTKLYEFFSRYVNPGKDPEPFDFSVDTITTSGAIIHRLKYTNCDAADFSWYLQEQNWIYQFSQKQQHEIREKYIFYCEGFRIDFPE